VKELLNQTKAGVHCATEEELRDYLLQAYREYMGLGRSSITELRRRS
jgi:hypothetical protein